MVPVQKSFKLTGSEVRKLTCRLPGLIIWDGTPFQVRICFSTCGTSICLQFL